MTRRGSGSGNAGYGGGGGRPTFDDGTGKPPYQTTHAQPGTDTPNGYQDPDRQLPEGGDEPGLNPDDVNRRTTESHAPSPVNRDGRMSYTETRGTPDPRPATAPYYEVTESDAQAAEEALSREEIPRAYQDEVRRYFESIQSPTPSPSGQAPRPSE